MKQIEWRRNPDFKVCERYEARLSFGVTASIMYFGKNWEWKIRLRLTEIAGGVAHSLEDAKEGCQDQWASLWGQAVGVVEEEEE